ncbi:MAG TPA: hypothetical protein VF161_06595 [Steroidobacteraceae bacterium]|jgi:hypothetical protein
MTQHSEERLPDDATSLARSESARILPFERPQSDLQRAIQQRAQEAIDLDLERDREVRKPRPLKRLIVFVVALIPVVLIFGAVDGFLRAFYRINEMYLSQPPAEQAPSEAPVSSTPGVVILQPYGVTPDAAPAEEKPDAARPEASTPPEQ